MSRSRRTAREAGTKFERLIADALAEHVDDRIDRRAKTGSKDRGDIGGLRSPFLPGINPKPVVVECKNTSRLELGVWINETDIERGNDDALAGIVVHKRRGTQDPLEQYVTMTLRDLIALLTGERIDR